MKALVGSVGSDVLAELASEADLWGSLPQHPGIVRVIHSSLSPSAPFLVLEACQEGTLFAAIRRGEQLDVRVLALDVARALLAIHEAGQTHRDVKSANVLLHREPGDRLVAKLCDWGSAAPLANSLPTRPQPRSWADQLLNPGSGGGGWVPVGTLLWMAPEMLQPHFEGSPPPAGTSGATADVYSFAVLLWELLERRLPWMEAGQVKRAEVVRHVVREGRRLPISPWVHRNVKALMLQCWSLDARKRPTMRQVVERLSAVPSWTDETKRPKAEPATPAVPPLAAPAAQALSKAEEAATLSEEEQIFELQLPAALDGGAPPPDDLAARTSAALSVEEGSQTANVEMLVSWLLPHARLLDAKANAELATSVAQLRAVEAQLQAVDSRRFDPLGAMKQEAMKRELAELRAQTDMLRAAAAGKAWARVGLLLEGASALAAREYAAERRQEEAARRLRK